MNKYTMQSSTTKKQGLLYKGQKMMITIFAGLSLLVSGCGNGTTPQAASTNSQPVAEKIQIKNGEHTLTFEQAPKRVVSMNQHVTEMLLALGVEDVMIGTAYPDDEVLPEYKAKYDQIKLLSKQYPSLEVFLSVEPDFVIGRSSAFTAKGIGSVEELQKMGIPAYTITGTISKHPTVDEVYEDLMQLGKILHVEDRAKDIIAKMKTDIQAIQQKIGNIEKPVKVLVFDSVNSGLYTTGNSLETRLIEMAGGQNVFGDLEKSWSEVSWEEAIKRAPDVIVINDYDKPSAEEKIKYLLENKALSDIPAIKNKRFVSLPLSDVFEGVRNVRAVEILAKGFYPQKF
ncbi:ABC transporter substrate-binding protein [Brevibacillus halotolerans]|uniref:ABC transporter substrate-binding protein n=1 Tax=Brevibacillus TaxID=55080 RepID=UPI00215CB718|nr:MULTISPECIES: ABC transporter substrate-binding protein [Brevibacillus]MCR8964681.1 ABC transporter substrate-binding protein [Brevibacillus laterosporus]MCZ0836836.1 ABC transporter substrate-binding protein [Brevibacillus halotolerans]